MSDIEELKENEAAKLLLTAVAAKFVSFYALRLFMPLYFS